MGGPDDDGQRVAGQLPRRRRIETGDTAPFRHLAVGKAEPPVSVLVAQEFQRMGREIDENEDAVWPQHERRLGDHGGGPIGVVQYLMNHHRVEGRVGHCQLVHVAEPDRPVFEPGPREVDPRDRQHLARLVDPERALNARRQNLQHTACAGADIEKIAGIGGGDDIDEGRLDLALIDVERADAVPLVGIFAEIGAREVGTLPLYRVQPLQVEGDRRVGIVASGDQLAGEGACRA